MKMPVKTMLFTALIAAVSLLQGCATKTYGRQGMVSDFERTSLSCREIDLEIARTQGFIAQVNKESEFSGRDVLAILGDFGIGNNLERTAALESANGRIDQLIRLRSEGRCMNGQATTVPTPLPSHVPYVIPQPRQSQ